MPHAGIFFLFSVLILSVHHNSSSNLRVVLSVQHVFVPLQRVWCYGVPLAIAAFPFLSDLQASHSSEHLWFVLFCFLFFLLFSFLFSSSIFQRSGLYRWFSVPGMLALHSLYLGELRLVGLLCLTVCDRRICVSL